MSTARQPNRKAKPYIFAMGIALAGIAATSVAMVTGQTAALIRGLFVGSICGGLYVTFLWIRRIYRG